MLVSNVSSQLAVFANLTTEQASGDAGLAADLRDAAEDLADQRAAQVAGGGSTEAIDAEIRVFIAQSTLDLTEASGGADVESVFQALAANDVLSARTGGGSADLIIGAEAIAGGGGDDVLVGSGADSVAVFSGARADYVIRAVDGGFEVSHLSGGDGVDTVFNVTALRFSDGDLAVNGGFATDLSATDGVVGESANEGDVVAVVSATAADADEGYTYSLTDDADGRFQIDAATGEISVALTAPGVLADDAFLHYDAARSAVDANDDGRVERLNDLSTSTNAHDAAQSSQSRRPELVEGAMNGRDALSFDGADDLMPVQDHGELNIDDFSAKTIALSFQTSDDTSSRQVIYEQGGGTNGLNIYLSDDRLYVGVWSEDEGWAGAYLSAAVEADTNYAVSLIFDGAAGALTASLNGVSLGSAATGAVLAEHAGDSALGGVNLRTQFHDGDSALGQAFAFKGLIGEAAMFNETLAASDQAALDDYMRAKWVGDVAALTSPPGASYVVSVRAESAGGDVATRDVAIRVPAAAAAENDPRRPLRGADEVERFFAVLSEVTRAAQERGLVDLATEETGDLAAAAQTVAYDARVRSLIRSIGLSRVRLDAPPETGSDLAKLWAAPDSAARGPASGVRTVMEFEATYDADPDGVARESLISLIERVRAR